MARRKYHPAGRMGKAHKRHMRVWDASTHGQIMKVYRYRRKRKLDIGEITSPRPPKPSPIPPVPKD